MPVEEGQDSLPAVRWRIIFEVGVCGDREAPTYPRGSTPKLRLKAKEAISPARKKEEKEESDRREASDRQ